MIPRPVQAGGTCSLQTALALRKANTAMFRSARLEHADGTCNAQTALRKAGIKQYGSPQGHLGLPPAPSERHEYGTNEVTLELVEDIQQAIDHIHQHGSSHTECIVTGGT